MTAGAHKALADSVMENIRGGTVGQQLVHAIRGGYASPDALLDAIQACHGGRLRGLARELQKALERGQVPL